MASQESTSIAGIQIKQDFGYGLSTKAKVQQPQADQPGPGQSKASKALTLAGYFVSGCMAINASQFLGAPLYLVNQDWYNAWIAFTKQSWGLLTMTMTQWWAPTIVRVSGDSTMRGQLLQTTDGSLVCNFPERMVLIANHQIYTDWLYLWWIGYAAGMHGRIYVVLKESLKKIPVIGWGMQFSQFIFLKRKWEQDKPRMAAHLQKFNNPKDPMWLMMFPEGTNLADSTRDASKKWAEKNGINDMQHTLLPRSTGLQFILQELRNSVDYIYDCTIAYEGVSRGEFAQDIFTVGASYFGGRPPKSVNMFWRRFRIADIPLDNSTKFELWLRQRWMEKDKFIEDYLRTGRLPADTGSSKDSKGQTVTGAGYIEAEIKPKYWYEFLQVFAPIGLFALVLYMFYGALPAKVLDQIKSIDQKTVLKKIAAYQRGEIKIPDQKKLKEVATKALQDQQKSGGSKLRNAALAHGVVTLNGVPQKDFTTQGLSSRNVQRPVKVQKLPPKAKPPSKVPHKPKGVTLNGVPLKDFTAKGLEGTENVPKPHPKTQRKVNVETGKIIPKLPATKKTKTRKTNDANSGQTPPKTSTKDLNPNEAGPNETIHQQSQSQPQQKTLPQPAPAEMPKASPPKPVQDPSKQTSGPNTSAPTKPTTKVNAPTTPAKPTKPTKPTSKPNAPAAQGKPAPKPIAPPATPTAPSEASEEKQVDNADVRRARKKLEIRQGKQEPKRKTRRAVEGSMTAS
ncbi:hypothetical protein ACLMJK_004445 [Lecanora helva]